MHQGVLEPMPHRHGEGIADEQIRGVRRVEYVAQNGTLAGIHTACSYSDEGDLVHKRVHDLGDTTMVVEEIIGLVV